MEEVFPLLRYFQSKHPNTDIICSGIFGVDSVEHGQNESINLDVCKKLILVLYHFLKEI